MSDHATTARAAIRAVQAASKRANIATAEWDAALAARAAAITTARAAGASVRDLCVITGLSQGMVRRLSIEGGYADLGHEEDPATTRAGDLVAC